jgi:hypothetical protein
MVGKRTLSPQYRYSLQTPPVYSIAVSDTRCVVNAAVTMSTDMKRIKTHAAPLSHVFVGRASVLRISQHVYWPVRGEHEHIIHHVEHVRLSVTDATLHI